MVAILASSGKLSYYILLGFEEAGKAWANELKRL